MVRKRPELVDRVRRTELRGLRDRDDGLLGAVHVPRAYGMHIHQVRGEQAVLRGDGPQLEAGDLLGRPALVDVDVRGLRADHGLPGPAHRLKRHDIGAGAVEDGEDLGLRAEVVAHEVAQALRLVVIAVRHGMAGIGAADRLEDLGVDAGVVVAGEAAPGCGHVRPP